MTYEPHWTGYIAALLVPMVALIAAGIAFLQWQTTRNRLKLELFDKRYDIYSMVTHFLNTAVSNETVTEMQLSEFLSATRQAKWLFSEPLGRFLEEEIYALGAELRTCQLLMEDALPDQGRSDYISHAIQRKQQLKEMYGPVDQQFAEYLSLTH